MGGCKWLGLGAVLALCGMESGGAPVTIRLETGQVLAECPDIRSAQLKVRELKQAGKLVGPTEVVLAAGIHTIAEPLRFTAADSGTPEAPITYRAETPGGATISGGRRIEGWQAEGNGVWRAEVPEVREGNYYFRQLFVNGRRAVRARSPNQGFYHTIGLLRRPEHTARQADGFYFAADDVTAAMAASPDTMIVAYQSWLSRQYRIKEFRPETQAVLTEPEMDIMRERSRFLVENSPVCLDAPGEWYLDRTTGIVRYIPLPGEEMGKAEIIAPTVPSLLQFRGDPEPGVYVEHLHFRNLRLAHADWTPQGRSISGGQARCPTGFEEPDVILESGAVAAIGLRHSSFENCEITQVGAHAVALLQGCTDNVVRACHLHDLGGGGVYLSWEIPQPGKRPSWRPRGEFDRILRNVVDNCFIHDLTKVFNGSVGVLAGPCAAETRITHNEISHGDYTGISIGWGWSANQKNAYQQEGNVVEYNHIHHVMNHQLDDGGAIYLLGWQPGARVCYNWIHDVRHDPLGHGAKGIYPDQGTAGVLFAGNVVHDVVQGFGGNGGHECIVRDNIFAFSQKSGVIGGSKWWDEQVRYNPHPIVFERNIVYQEGGSAMFMRTGYRPEAQVSRHNLYWAGPESAGEARFSGADLAFVPFAEWQGKGHDEGSIMADPLFVDAARRDFRLRPDSPARNMGFQETDLSKVGLYGDPAWTGLPARVRHAPIVIPSGPGGLVWTYEHELPDAPPAHSGKLAPGPAELGHRIVVTETDAASGKRSLMLVEGKNSERSFFPFLYSPLGVAAGPVQASFQLKMPAANPSAMYFSFRDYHNTGSKHFQTGPYVQVDAQGVLTASPAAKVNLTLPRDLWVRFDLAFVLGPDAAKTFDLTVTIPGQPPRTFPQVPFTDPEFQLASDLYLVSIGPDGGCFLIDDIRVTVAPVPEARP